MENTWCSHCGGSVQGGKCTNEACALSKKQ